MLNVSGSGGKFAGNVFLFSGGFFLSGYANGTLFSNAVASATLVGDYVQGTVADGSSDPRAQFMLLNLPMFLLLAKVGKIGKMLLI